MHISHVSTVLVPASLCLAGWDQGTGGNKMTHGVEFDRLPLVVGLLMVLCKAWRMGPMSCLHVELCANVGEAYWAVGGIGLDWHGSCMPVPPLRRSYPTG